MTATNHALTGTVIALVVKKPELAIPLAFASHFVIDIIPHFEARDLSRRNPKLFIFSDVFSSAILTVCLAVFLHSDVSGWTIFFSASAAVLPDFMWGWRYLRIRDMDKVFQEPMSWLARFHLDIQFSETRLGIIPEAIWLAVMAGLIVKLA